MLPGKRPFDIDLANNSDDATLAGMHFPKIKPKPKEKRRMSFFSPSVINDAGLIAADNEYAIEIFIKTIKDLFRLLGISNISPSDCSEILREIARYHRKNIAEYHQHNNALLPKDQHDLYPTVLFLYEKAVAIGDYKPNQQAANELEFYLTNFMIPIFPDPKTKSNSTDRIKRYVQETNENGYIKFFLLSINKYLERMVGVYKENLVPELRQALQHLINSDAVKKIMASYMTSENQKAIHELLDSVPKVPSQAPSTGPTNCA